MKKILCLIFVSSYIFAQNLSPRNANYTIHAKLDIATKSIIGNEIITWTNITNTPTNEIQLHLYMNAFKDEKSTFMKESANSIRASFMDKDFLKNTGNIYITTCTLNQKINLYPNIKFISPDDGNLNDKTVVSIKLPKTVQPNETIQIEINFKTKLPKIVARAGWSANDYFLMAQWYPKIGVFEQKNNLPATWNCHQYHATTEFYADFGVYDVSINLPKNYVLGASGNKISEQNSSNNTKTARYIAKDVIDFAWTASPHFIVNTETYKGIKLTALLQPEHQDHLPRFISAAKYSIDYMQTNLGKYPHKTLTMVDPPFSGAATGGMEYPTFITCHAYWGIGPWMKSDETVTIHEFIHQYFQGILASNEFEESFMDEGFTQYYEGLIMDEYYPKGSRANILGLNFNEASIGRYMYVSMDNPRIAPINTKAWIYPGDSYGILTYFKTATVLKNLEGILGKKNMKLVMKNYFEKYKFKHPTLQNFTDEVNLVASNLNLKNLDWYITSAFNSTEVCDYAITEIKNADRKAKPAGRFTVENLGDLRLPYEIKVIFEDKKTQTIHWNGTENLKTFHFNRRITSVEIDQKKLNWLDINQINNSKSINSSTAFGSKFGTKMIFWVQQILANLFGLI